MGPTHPRLLRFQRKTQGQPLPRSRVRGQESPCSRIHGARPGEVRLPARNLRPRHTLPPTLPWTHPVHSDLLLPAVQQGHDPLPSNPDSPSCFGSPFSPSPLPSKAQAPPHPTQGRQEVSLRAVVPSSCKGSPGLGHRHGRGELGRGFRHIRSDDHEGLLRDKVSKGGGRQENRRPGPRGHQVQGMNRAGAA